MVNKDLDHILSIHLMMFNEQVDRMNAITHRGLHFPPSIIQRAAWLYARFNMSLRDVEDLMAERESKPCMSLSGDALRGLVGTSRDVCDQGVGDTAVWRSPMTARYILYRG